MQPPPVQSVSLFYLVDLHELGIASNAVLCRQVSEILLDSISDTRQVRSVRRFLSSAFAHSKPSFLKALSAARRPAATSQAPTRELSSTPRTCPPPFPASFIRIQDRTVTEFPTFLVNHNPDHLVNRSPPAKMNALRMDELSAEVEVLES